MSDDEKVGTLTDQYGDQIVASALNGDVCIQFYRGPHDFIGMWLTPRQQEEFAQLYVAACHQAKVNAEAEHAETHGPGCYCTACNAERREEALEAAEIVTDRRERLDID